jgi:putative oxidoreductase
MQKFTPLIGRIFLSAIFLMSGLGKIANFSGTQQYMAAYGMPMTSLFLIGAIILEVGGGLSILLGYKAKWGALALIIFIIPATLIFHTNFSDQTQMIMFMKNIAILGGLVLIVANGAGSLSLDNRTTRT